MYYYFYYGYLGYLAMRYSYILDYGYMTFHYGNRLRHWAFDKPPVQRVEDIEEDWVLCNAKEPDVIVMD
jgi:hypothetical protein